MYFSLYGGLFHCPENSLYIYKWLYIGHICVFGKIETVQRVPKM
jgi:hypothetical protein